MYKKENYEHIRFKETSAEGARDMMAMRVEYILTSGRQAGDRVPGALLASFR